MIDHVTGKPKLHPLTGEPLKIEELECPRGSVVLMWCAGGQESIPYNRTSRTMNYDLDFATAGRMLFTA